MRFYRTWRRIYPLFGALFLAVPSLAAVTAPRPHSVLEGVAALGQSHARFPQRRLALLRRQVLPDLTAQFAVFAAPAPNIVEQLG